MFPNPFLIIRTCFYVNDMQSIPCITSRKNCEITKIGKRSLGFFEKIRKMNPRKTDKFMKRLERGDECYLALVGSDPVHYSWVQTEGKHYIKSAGRVYNISKGEFFIFDSLTAEWGRGLHLFPFVLSNILNEFQESKEFHRAYIYTENTNLPSRKAVERAGFVLNKKWKSLVIRGRKLPFPF